MQGARAGDTLPGARCLSSESLFEFLVIIPADDPKQHMVEATWV